MSRYHPDDQPIQCPDDIEPRPSLDYGDDYLDANPHPWVREDVYAYRDALVRLGLDAEAIEDVIARDCGNEFVERPMLSVRQAS